MYTQVENSKVSKTEAAVQRKGTLHDNDFVDNRPRHLIQKRIIDKSYLRRPLIASRAMVGQACSVVQLKQVIIPLFLRSKVDMARFKEFVETHSDWTYISDSAVEVGESDIAASTIMRNYSNFLTPSVPTPRLEDRDAAIKMAIEVMFKHYPTAKALHFKEGGHNNNGIFEVPAEDGQSAKIIKLKCVECEGRRIDAERRRNDELAEISKYAPSMGSGIRLSIAVNEISVLCDHFYVSIKVYDKIGGETLQDIIKSSKPVDFIKLGVETANFHFSAFKTKKQFIVHGDFNTTNIMMDEGTVGIVDADDVRFTTDIRDVVSDIETLLSTMKAVIGEDIFEAVKGRFIEGYIGYGASRFPEIETLRGLLRV